MAESSACVGRNDSLGVGTPQDDNMGHNDRIFMLLQLQEEKFW